MNAIRICGEMLCRMKLTDPSQRPAGSAPVEMLVFSFPIQLPSEAEPDSGGEPGSGGAQ